MIFGVCPCLWGFFSLPSISLFVSTGSAEQKGSPCGRKTSLLVSVQPLMDEVQVAAERLNYFIKFFFFFSLSPFGNPESPSRPDWRLALVLTGSLEDWYHGHKLVKHEMEDFRINTGFLAFGAAIKPVWCCSNKSERSPHSSSSQTYTVFFF